MGISTALSGLLEKHIELQTTLRDLEDAADKAEDDIAQIAKTIRILDPDYPTEDLRPKRKRFRRIHAETGNLKRHVGTYVAASEGEFTSSSVRETLLSQGAVKARTSDMTYLTLRIALHLKQMASLGIIKQVDRLKNKNSIVWKRVN